MLVGHTVVELTLCQFVHLLSTDSFNILNTVVPPNSWLIGSKKTGN